MRDAALRLDDLVTSDPVMMGGRHVFRGTRVPVEVLFENLADGLALDEILDAYESLDRDDVIAVLECAARSLAAPREVLWTIPSVVTPRTT